MLLIKKGAVPEELITAKAEGCRRYDDLPSGVKQAMRTQLYKEQHGLCAYCMAMVTDSNAETIEHIIPQSTPVSGDSQSLEWTNMVLVCNGGRGGAEKNLSCDASKRDKMLSELSPLKESCIPRLFYSHSGRIESVNNQYKTDLNDVLNLNIDRLVYSRKQALNIVQRRITVKGYNKQAMKKRLLRILEKLQRPDSDGNLEPYAGVGIWYIKDKLSKIHLL